MASAKRDVLKSAAVLAQSDLAFSTAIEVVEDRPGDTLFSDLTQVLYVHDAR